jgi:hypothetical protein
MVILVHFGETSVNELNCKPFYVNPEHGRTCEINQAILKFNAGTVSINASSDLVKYVLFINSTLTFLPKEIFTSFQNVVMIGISRSRLDDFNSTRFFEEVGSLEKLRIINSNISDLSNETFNALRNLRWIRLSNVNLHYLPAGLFKNNEKLEYIDLYYNNIINIDLKIFSNLPRLHEVDLRKNVCVNEQFFIKNGNVGFMEEELWLCDGTIVITTATKLPTPPIDLQDNSNSYIFIFVIIGLFLIWIIWKRKAISHIIGIILK